jgi:hypothetical protein
MSRVRVLLDVDGVLNACRSSGDFGSFVCPEGYVQDTATGFPITYNPAVGEFLAPLSERAEILWLTTWEELAPKVFGPMLGLPEFEVASWCRTRKGSTDEVDPVWWKWGVARSLWELDGRPFVWLDDDLRYLEPVAAWLGTIPATHRLAIAPRSHTGLVRADLDRIAAFVATHDQEQAA